MTNILPTDLKERLAKLPETVILDVRTPREFSGGHLPSAINLPLDQLSATNLEKLGIDSSKSILTICQHGKRGENACQLLQKLGFSNVMNIVGGTAACQNLGLAPKNDTVISLERQVRIAAGAFVLIGVLLSFWISSFIYLSAFVGAGLIFAGITDTCALGLLLSRLPYNQNSNCSCKIKN